MRLFILLIYIAGIGFVRGGAKGSDEIQNADLESLVSTFWDWRQREWPVYGTMFGFHQYDMFLENFTESAFTAQKNAAADFLGEANLINQGQLDDRDGVTLAVLKDLLTHFIDGYHYRKYSIYNSELPPYEEILSRMPMKTLKDYQSILARYRLIGDQIEDIVTLLKEEAKLDGTTMYPTTVLYKLSKAHKFDDELSEPLTSSLYEPFLVDNIPADIDDATKSEMQTEVLELMQQQIKPAVENYINYLGNSYGKVGSVNRRTEPGLHSVKGGLDHYKACLKWHLSTDITPRELHNIGLQEIERIRKLMAEIVKSEGFEGTLSEYMDHLQHDPNNFYKTSEEILKGYENIIAENHGRLLQVLLKIPDYQIIVVGSRGGASGFYTDPTLDGSKPGTFSANIENPQEKLIFNMDPLTLHEAEPGHHTQFTYVMESDVPLFRKLIQYFRPDAVPFNWQFYTAYVEGWALYAERLGIEMGSYSDPRRLFGKYNSEMYRAVRLVVDTGIHAFGWSMEQAEDYMKNHTTLGESNIKYEIMRYVANPGQACGYKIGEMKILELRKEAEEKLGLSFDKREFHDVILSVGPVPLSIMEDQVHKWMNKKSSEISASYASFPSVQLILICFHSYFIHMHLGSTI